MINKDAKSEVNFGSTNSDDRSIAHAEIDRDSLKALFHILVGKPDSTIQVHLGPFELTVPDIANLNDSIIRKMRNHNVATVNSNAYLTSNDRLIREFGTIEDLLDYPQGGSEETQSITLKWDFLINIESYKIPQRHSLSVRVGKTPDAKDTLRKLFSQTDEPDDPHDLAFAPMYCRADFVSPILGKELLNLVKDWHKGLKRPMGVSPLLKNVRKYERAIARAIEYTIPFSVGLCCVAAFKFLLSAYPATDSVTIGILEKTGLWFAASLAAIYIATITARLLASSSLSNLTEIRLRSVAFCLSNGDHNFNQKEIDRSNRKFRSFIISSSWALFVNILATYLAFRLGIGTPG
ncbi:hypothetical protein FJN17_09610 [Bradyrhizobium symbiodeficiens]|uniref:DUF2868 domain-containing protein n=1 Tax=Bradyrhizobium symbiodeficiens TaxID=1404367 RepID=A0ABX5W6E2_9BRAD|nr:hypothetical protein [Bradyrhizobium symbiodeficiens]QDF37809.1 hypothetical protein FJN17_09610 [Bradyrhizobium symbiodeficiens]